MLSSSYKSAARKALAVCRAVADGDFEARILNITETGDAGELLHAINLLIDRTDAYMRESKACLDYVSRNQYFRLIERKGMVGAFGDASDTINAATMVIKKRSDDFSQIASRFEDHMKNVVESVSTSVGELQSVSEAVNKSSSSANEQSTAVAAGAEQASTNMQNVSASTEELSSAIEEINRQVVQSSGLTSDTVLKSRQMSDQITQLAEASQRIGQVLKLINDVTDQTNLLALNATIEAARAGDAGKGFSVVAQEVKALASQTTKATEDIAAQIVAVQKATSDAVEANTVIGQSIAKANEVSTAIAAAVEEQSAATREIARNVEEAAVGTTEVSASINQVRTATRDTESAVSQVVHASTQLAKQEKVLANLRVEMRDFLVELRKTG